MYLPIVEKRQKENQHTGLEEFFIASLAHKQKVLSSNDGGKTGFAFSGAPTESFVVCLN